VQLEPDLADRLVEEVLHRFDVAGADDLMQRERT
jgi:hypothetical protein